MNRQIQISIRGILLGSLVATAAAVTPAKATDGYFQVGFGARQSATGGAGVADSRDAMAQSLNPAGIAGLDRQMQIGGAIFMPYRGYDATGAGFVTGGSVDSGKNFFVMPNFAYIHPLDADSTLGFTVYGNGGMNTSYANMANPACGPGSGVFCGGAAGVDLMQAFISADYARRFGSLKIGIAPTMAVQLFKATGLGAFSAFSADPANLTNNGYDVSIGAGLRGGIEWEAMPGLRFGLSAQTKMYMSRFDKYAGLFAGRGSFDIPASITAGVAFDPTEDFTLMLDYQHIFYGDVPAISNSTTAAAPFGSAGGPGFGWTDLDVFKVGAEWRANDTWTFRAGYAYSENPISAAHVTMNILAPGVTQHHFTAGAAYKISERDTIEFSGMYVPSSTVSGIEMTPGGPNPGRSITLNMHQVQLLASWTRKF
ncbi:outer membrane protein transport protein [Hoeflea sp.]|uniref:OmpP1/FadL family transporter n=1 Tax=Hoeflea sp. TaxID=1940281 RepID=UPI0019AF0CD2|nr:outer membrane protein transport protein [Hoeflea sp.]MBC7281444.1 outer membrane protein transport protein [Hoeflea sp.]